jgi:hypothetical protein
MSATARFAIPLLAAGQAQKELYHNEAVQTLETVASPSVEEGPRVSPPASPAVGACYIVAASPTGAWAGRPLNLAVYTAGGWRFVAPLEGVTAFVRSSSVWATFRSGVWELGILRGSNVTIAGQQVVGGRTMAIPGPSGGSVIDLEVRSAVGQILTALRQHGLIET